MPCGKRQKNIWLNLSSLALIFLLPLVSILCLNSLAVAKMFKYVSSSGIIHLSNVPGTEGYQAWEEVPEGYNGRRRKASVKEKDEITKAVELAARRYGVNSNLVKAVIKTESNFNPQAISPKGAMGLMQLMPETAKQYGVENPFNLWENIQGGVQHLDYLLSKYDYNLERVLAAYNAGKGQVERYNGVPPFPETIDYINRVFYYYQNPRTLHSGQVANHNRTKKANKIFRYVSPNGVVLFTNVRQ